jgi:transcriptional regulator with XRE-family HTH domain
MQLKTYLERNGMTQTEFAAECRRVVRGWRPKQPDISRWVNGEVAPTVLVRTAIEQVTNGAVARGDW